MLACLGWPRGLRPVRIMLTRRCGPVCSTSLSKLTETKIREGPVCAVANTSTYDHGPTSSLFLFKPINLSFWEEDPSQVTKAPRTKWASIPGVHSVLRCVRASSLLAVCPCCQLCLGAFPAFDPFETGRAKNVVRRVPRAEVLNLGAATPLGVEGLFHRGCLRSWKTQISKL